jgi:phage shock protein PspC (stress-responsive transcriptional regulator)
MRVKGEGGVCGVSVRFNLHLTRVRAGCIVRGESTTLILLVAYH